jgi:hypothetical protein
MASVARGMPLALESPAKKEASRACAAGLLFREAKRPPPAPEFPPPESALLRAAAAFLMKAL